MSSRARPVGVGLFGVVDHLLVDHVGEVAFERAQMDRLVEFIKAHQPGEGFVLPFVVPDNPKIRQFTDEGKAVAVHSPEGRAWFGAIAEEIERRIRQ